MQVKEWMQFCKMTHKISATYLPGFLALCVWVHAPVFWLVFLVIFPIVVPSPKTAGSCSLPFFFSLFSIYCLQNNCFSCMQHRCPWTISLFLFKAVVAILALKWHLSTRNVCSFQFVWNVFCVLHEVTILLILDPIDYWQPNSALLSDVA